MIRGTTPTIEFNLPFAASSFSEFYITFSQNGNVRFEKTQKDCVILDSKITVTLSQNDTLKLKSDYIKIQIRGKTKANDVLASNIMIDYVNDVLKEGVI